MEPPAATRRAAVLGHPVGHSLSPELHLAAYRHLGLDWSYEAIDVTREQLPEFFDTLDENWVGLSLTMPLKEAVIPLLTTIDPLAKTLRSVNTVTLSGAGSQGCNTDVLGLAEVLRQIGVRPQSRVTILGAGATARSAVASLSELDSGPITVCARRSAGAAGLVALAQELGSAAAVGHWPPLPHEIEVPTVISTLPADAPPLALDDVSRGFGHLVDVVYDPWPSPLASAWQSAGGSVTGGLEMLVYQAVEQVRLMTGHQVGPDILRSAGLRALRERGIAQGEQ